METIKINKNEYQFLLECFNWNIVNDGNDKRLFPDDNEENKKVINSIFKQFQSIEIVEVDKIYGIFDSGQKVVIAKAPEITKTLRNKEISSVV